MNMATLFAFLQDPESCELSRGNDTLQWIDDSGVGSRPDSLFVAGGTYGASWLVHARSWEEAYEALIDELPAIPDADLPDAYGVDETPEMAAWEAANPSPPYHRHDEWRAWCDAKHAAAMAILQAWDQDARDGKRDDYPELQEGYTYKSNFGGTNGIVDTSDLWMVETDGSDIDAEIKAPEAARKVG